jgi:DNA-binding CsgD family transcriptional regulator
MARASASYSELVNRLPEIVPASFVGREREMAAVAEALSMPAAVVLLDGEAGIGKSRLLREFLISPAGQALRPLMATCPPLRQPHTLGPMVDAIRQTVDSVAGLGLSPLAGTLRPLFPEWAGELPRMPEPAGDATAARHRVFRALAELLGELGIGLLMAEDVHWADEATLEFLLFLAARHAAQARQLRLVISWRPEDVPIASLLWRLTSRAGRGGTGRRISLGPLDVKQTAELMSSMVAGEAVSAEFATFVHERTEGVPLAVEESMRVMGERADLAHRRGRWVRRSVVTIDVPPTIRDAVLERTQRLGADARQVLSAAAVLGEPAPEPVLVAVSGLDPGPAGMGLAEALRCGLLEDDGHGLTSFRHALVAQAVYEALPAPHRRMLHRRAGAALEGIPRQTAARLARHFREAGDVPKWLHYAEQAAELAIASGDRSAAAQLLHDVLANATLPAAVAVRVARKIPFPSLTGHHEFRALARTLRSVMDDQNLTPGQRAEIRFQLGQVLLGMEEWVTGRAELELAIPHLRHDRGAAARAMMLLAWPRGTTCPGSEHVRWLQRAARLTASLAPADRLSFAVDRASALLQLGRQEGWEEAARLPARAPDAQAQRDICRSHLNIGDAAMTWGHHDEAARRLAAAADLAERYQYPSLRAQIHVTQLQLDWLAGSWGGLADRARQVDTEDAHPVTRLMTVLITGLLHAAAGERDRAEADLRLALAETSRIGAAEYSLWPAAALVKLRVADGRAEDAIGVSGEPMDIVSGKGVWVWATDLAPARTEALVAAGRIGEAAALVAAFARGLRGRDAPAPRSALALCRAIVAAGEGEHARAAGQFARAAASWQAIPRPYDALLAREHQARCLLAAGKREPGLAQLGEVLLGLDQLGATGDASRVASRLRGHGVAVSRPWRGGPRGYGDRLSPRELDVVRLVIAGRTNREIAGALHRSPNTVSTQLKSAMRKLHVSSRTALAMSAADVGILPGEGPARGSG